MGPFLITCLLKDKPDTAIQLPWPMGVSVPDVGDCLDILEDHGVVIHRHWKVVQEGEAAVYMCFLTLGDEDDVDEDEGYGFH